MASIELLPTQVECIEQGLQILKKHGWVYYAMQERTGKTLTALFSAFQFNPNAKVVIYTKKRALQGWQEWIEHDEFKGKDITLINYEANYTHTKSYDIAILDESHNYISSYPKPSVTLKKIFPIVFNCHVIYCSATPCAESYSKLFYQLFLCQYSPFSYHKFKSFYQWHRVYGIPYQKRINGLLVNDYSKTKEALVLATIEPYFVRVKRNFKHEPQDILVECEYTAEQMKLIKLILKGGLENYVSGGVSYNKIVDTKLKEMLALWQIEGGTLICDDNQILSIPTNKVKAITNKDAITFCYFKAEAERLKGIANVYHYTKHSEGIDLSMHDKAYIYTPTFSATKYSQVRSRLSRFDRDKPINIVWLHNGENSICYQIYQAVYNKNKKFTLRLFSESDEYNKVRQGLLNA